MKKAIALALSLVLSLGMLAGCGGSGGGKEPEYSGPSYDALTVGADYTDLTAELRVITQRTDLVDTTFAQYVEEFNKLYPNIKINYEGITNYQDDMTARLSSRNWGDICMMPTNILLPDLSLYFHPLCSYDALKDTYNFASNRMFDNTVYGIPSTGNAQGVSRGLTEDSPTATNWEGCKPMMNRGEIGVMVLDTILGWVGITNTPNWLENQAINNIVLVCCSLWKYLGQNIVLFIGAIASVDPTLYEAADLDGANAWQRFKCIIIPSIRTIVVLNLILSVSGALSAFEMPYVVTNGTFGTSTYFVVMNKLAHTDMKVGLASAMAVVLLALILVVTLVQKLAEIMMDRAENRPHNYGIKEAAK